MIRSSLFAGALITSLASFGAGADLQVWTVQDTRHVLREDPAGASTGVKLAAARNEWESFQVLLRSTSPAGEVNVEPGTFKAADGSTLDGARVVLYRQHQLQLTERSARNDQFRPGWYPDPLIPAVHPMTGKPLEAARFTAAGFDLPAQQTHGYLVDVYVPPVAKAGTYRAVCRVTARGVKAAEIPVELTVWDFELPQFSAFQTALGSPGDRLRGYYRKRAKQGKEKEPADWDAVDAQIAQLLSDHRINASPPAGSLTPVAQPDGKYQIPAEQVARFREFVDRYHVNAYDIPHPRTAIKDPEVEQEKLRAWLASWNQAAKELDRPQVVFYTYLLDEPNDEEAYRFVQKWGRAIRAAKSVVKVLVVEQTLTQSPAWGDLNGAVDIWCPLFCLHDPKTAAERQALGETIWTYTALCQGKKPSPWWQIDFPLLNYRVPMWIAWRYRMRGLLYWGGMSYWSGVDDPWTDPKTLDRRTKGKGPLYNGEGNLLYPARAVGYDGITPSLRLKALRDGIEDYEYLANLERLGRAAQAEKVVLPQAASWFDWEADPAAYGKARVKLAEMILGGTP